MIVMRSLADLILGSSNDAQAIVNSDYPLGTYSGVNIDGLNPLYIVELHALLTEKMFSQLLPDYKPVAEGSTRGPWLIRIPPALIEVLSNLAPHDYSLISIKWASTDRLQEVPWSEQDAENYLAQLVHFSQLAVFEGKEMFLCAYN
jgi:hypothetical protein